MAFIRVLRCLLDVRLPPVQELEHRRAVAGGTAGSRRAPRDRADAAGRPSTISPIVAAGPFVIITMRSASSTASSTSCVTISTVLPVCHDLHELVLQLRARQRVERAERLVEQQHLRLHRERARDADALLHAAGHLVRHLVLGVRRARRASAPRACARLSCARDSVAPNTRSTARYTLSKHVSHGSSEWFWNTTPRSGPGPAISRPAQSSTPVGRLRAVPRRDSAASTCRSPNGRSARRTRPSRSTGRCRAARRTARACVSKVMPTASMWTIRRIVSCSERSCRHLVCGAASSSRPARAAGRRCRRRRSR